MNQIYIQTQTLVEFIKKKRGRLADVRLSY